MTTQSVAAALSLTEHLAENGPTGLSELARRLELSKATALRLLRTLEEHGWVSQSPAPSRAWAVTSYLSRISRAVTSDAVLRDASLESMNQLQLQSQETVHLASVEKDHLVLIERLDSSHELRAFFALGTLLPLHASATGLAYLSALTDAEVNEHLNATLEARTDQTMTDRDTVLAAVHDTRVRGFSVNSGGLVTDIASVGAPLIGGDGTPVGALSVSGPSSRLSAEIQLKLGPLVNAAAQTINRRLRA